MDSPVHYGSWSEQFKIAPVGSLGGHNNPYSRIAALLVVESDAEEGWITDVNRLCCDIVGWDRGEYGDDRDPGLMTETLIGKPLDVLIPPSYRKAHRLFRQAFAANPEPRTMGEGRNTPLWVRDRNSPIEGADARDRLESIKGRATTVLIGLSAMDEHHAVAMVQAMAIGKSFSLPR